MAKHESESTYMCMDNTRMSEKTFFVPLVFGGNLLTIVIVMNTCIENKKFASAQLNLYKKGTSAY